MVSVLENARNIPYSEIDGFTDTTVQGHEGALYYGTIGGVPVVILAGRRHLYEGCTPVEVVHAVRTIAQWGCKVVLLTNAAGGVEFCYRVGDFMVLKDHINFTGRNPLVGENDCPGPRFPDMSRVYDVDAGRILANGLEQAGGTVREGVYLGVVGPSYETPAEIRMFGDWGAHAVGMSTVLEAIALRHMGCRVAGVSIITNAAAGVVTSTVLAHEEVQDAGARATPRLIAGIVHAVPAIASVIQNK